MTLVRIDRVLRRVWVLNRRIHHGLAGALLVAVGTALMLHDRRDWREWV